MINIDLLDFKIKKKLLGLVCLSVFALATVQTTNATDQYNEIEQAFKKVIEQNNEFAKCSPSSSDSMVKVLGITNGKCHFYSGFIEVDDKKLPANECYVPMNVLKQEIQKQNEMLSKGHFRYSSENDPYAPYCKRLHGTVKTSYGSLSY